MRKLVWVVCFSLLRKQPKGKIKLITNFRNFSSSHSCRWKIAFIKAVKELIDKEKLLRDKRWILWKKINLLNVILWKNARLSEVLLKLIASKKLSIKFVAKIKLAFFFAKQSSCKDESQGVDTLSNFEFQNKNPLKTVVKIGSVQALKYPQ